jgi:GNAT superfamily N-acetyltransferase
LYIVIFIQLPGAAVAKLENLFSLLRDDIDVFDRLNSEHLLKEFGLVVKPEYRRMNIGTELFKTIERMGNVFRIHAAVIILGNVSSQGLSAKLGLKIIKEIKLTDYKDENGQIIFPATDAKAIQYGYFKYF